MLLLAPRCCSMLIIVTTCIEAKKKNGTSSVEWTTPLSWGNQSSAHLTLRSEACGMWRGRLSAPTSTSHQPPAATQLIRRLPPPSYLRPTFLHPLEVVCGGSRYDRGWYGSRRRRRLDQLWTDTRASTSAFDSSSGRAMLASPTLGTAPPSVVRGDSCCEPVR
jgi:hypothetical protein